MQRAILIIILAAFLGLSGMALFHHGYLGIITLHFQTYGGAQVLTDLVIALSLFLVWLWKDAKVSRRNPYPWIIFTLATGSIGAILYVILYKTNNSR